MAPNRGRLVFCQELGVPRSRDNILPVPADGNDRQVGQAGLADVFAEIPIWFPRVFTPTILKRAVGEVSISVTIRGTPQAKDLLGRQVLGLIIIKSGRRTGVGKAKGGV